MTGHRVSGLTSRNSKRFPVIPFRTRQQFTFVTFNKDYLSYCFRFEGVGTIKELFNETNEQMSYITSVKTKNIRKNFWYRNLFRNFY